jgi:hypothetical protein
MNSTKNLSTGWKLWLWWVFASIVGLAVGIGGSMAASLVVSEILALLAFGLLLGLAQWLVLRKIFPDAGWWLLANVLGIPLGFAAANTLHVVILWEASSVFNLALDFGILGLVLGTAQWLLLSRHFRKAGLWIITSITGWAVGGLVTLLIHLSSDLFTVLAGYAAIGVIVGIFTGLGLLILNKFPVPPQTNGYYPRGYLVIAGCTLLLIITAIVFERFNNRPVAAPDLSQRPVCDNLPPLECTGDEAYCAELVPFEPVTGPGYSNYPENGETWDDQFRSYLRRDLMMAVKYASAKVMCETQEWDYAPFRDLGLGDMSESDGSIPGTSIGQPGHPAGTHESGNDIDIAYYQVNARSVWLNLVKDQQEDNINFLAPVCKSTKFWINVNHCTEPPRSLDPWRTALFIASLSEHPRLRVIGVDGQVGPVLFTSLEKLEQNGWFHPDLQGMIPFTYETTNEGWGWFFHHQHHMHISMQPDP